ncbi:FAD binding domain protein [Melanomma pulvis-pyrius CBS 109.77]|uniref:FAD binding domain protein n=1 Tax=Melanomma pulvis-pyrius CBS 109.77 TaxID=1314802 RepID=A0A6A6XQT7_9PLEO|nr:FAD binding domain protein [Melanomma pulvis-pyrius CBS 109.77]
MVDLAGDTNRVEATSPLRLLVCGAGIGGLTAAIALRQQGHHVTMLEKSKLAAEVGAAIHLAPNCTAVLNQLGVFPEHFGGTLTRKMIALTKDGHVMHIQDYDAVRNNWKSEWYTVLRADLHTALKRKATSLEGSGPPVTIYTSSTVTKVDCMQSSVALEDGRVFSGDAVICAEGVHSATRVKIFGGEYKPFKVGKSCFRWLLPKEKLNDHLTAKYCDQPGELLQFSAEDRRFVMYPCSDNTVLNFGAFVPSEEVATDNDLVNNWNSHVDKKSLLRAFADFEPGVRRMCELADETSLMCWEMLDMPVMSRWTLGHVAVLGDAAHPFMPYMGQGGSMAIEDAASLSVVLHKGTKPSHVQDRLRIYEKCRKERADRIQDFTRRIGRDFNDPKSPRPTRMF